MDKLKEQVTLHKYNSDILMSYTDEKWVRDGVEVKVPKKYKKYGGWIFEECLSHCIIAPSSVVIHKSLFEKVGVFDETLEVCEDYDLWLRMACENEIGLVDKKLIIKYAGHKEQLSFKHWGMDRFRVFALEKLQCCDKKDLVTEILQKKYILLLKGAIKHDKIAYIKHYEQKLKDLKVDLDG